MRQKLPPAQHQVPYQDDGTPNPGYVSPGASHKFTDDTTLIERAQAYVDRKYVARADDRQRSMGLAYVEAEREDLAREFAKFAADEIRRNAGVRIGTD
jgi:hypothetical protein